MKTKIVSMLLFFTIVIAVFTFFPFSVSAETEGIFDYYDESDYGYVMIAKCNKPVGKVVIPSEIAGSPVVTIHDGAFRDATELTAVVIPKSVSGIYATSFVGCTNLKDVYYEGSATEWNKIQIGFESVTDGGIRDIPLLDATIHFNGDEDVVPKKSGNFEYVIENKKAIIMRCDRNVKGKVEIPEKLENYPVREIGNHAFFNCTRIEEIKLPSTIDEIGTSAFTYCEQLKKINIPQTVKGIRSFAFFKCTSLENIALPNTITEITMSMFMESGLKNIVIPPSAKTISYRAFAWCRNLENIKLSEGLETVEEGAFSYTAIKELTFPEGFKKTEMWAATYCENLEVISFPKTTEEIGLKICEGCTKLKSVKYSGGKADWEKVNLMQPNNEIGKIDIEFSNKKPTIGTQENGYYYIIENEKATVIGCDSDVSESFAEIPDTLGGYPVTKIAPNAFASTKINSITIPSGVTEIGANAFAYCNAACSVYIPLSVKTIGENAFYACNDLADVYYEGQGPDWQKIKFSDEQTKTQFENMAVNYGAAAEENYDGTGLAPVLISAFSVSVILIIVIIFIKKKKTKKAADAAE